MGNGSLIIIYYKGLYAAAQYSQSYGYPAGEGRGILEFFRMNPKNLQALKDKIHVVYVPSKNEMKTINETVYRLDREMLNSITENALDRWYPGLSRKTGSDILDTIVKTEEGVEIPVQMNLDFAADYKFCEWVYVIDLDGNRLEVYSGRETKEGARSKRFIDLWSVNVNHKNEKLAAQGVVPRMLGDFSLTNLPDVNYFVAYFKELAAAEDDN